VSKNATNILNKTPETTSPTKLSQLKTSNKHKRDITVTVSII
jgi:hypothetical protein